MADKIESALIEAMGTNKIGLIIGEVYSKKELEVLAAGIWADHPNEKVFYSDKYGTFKNEAQYNALKEEDKAKFEYKFENTGKPLSKEEQLEELVAKMQKQLDELAAQKAAAAQTDPSAPDDIPTDKSNKKQIAAYLVSKGVEASESESKEDLVAKLKGLA